MRVKRIVLAVAVATTLFSCTSPEKKAQNLIKEHLKQTLNDPKSYDPVSFGSLDSTYSTVMNINEYKMAESMSRAFLKSAKESTEKISYSENYEIYSNHARQCLDTVSKYSEIMEKIENEFIPEFNGWEMKHKLRAKNAMGALVLNDVIFYFYKVILQR